MSDGSLEEDALGWNLGRYTLHGEIASGGMATVHIGRMVGSAGFAKMVAIKRLHEQFAGDPNFVAMFLDEARLAARVHHPNVVQPLDVITTDGEVFLVMEYVRGESLSRIQRLMRTHGRRMPIKIVGAIMVGVLHGLHAAHEATSERGSPLGIVHRDVSPQNVLVGTDGIARVLDFGIAKASDRAHHTREGDLKGKLAYMSPEQLSGAPDVDRRTDVFAASVVLWELLTGQRLYESDSVSTIAARSRGDVAKAPSEFAPEVSEQVDRLVKKGLARDRDVRFASAREMAIALEMAMPLATPSKVGEWVEEVAADSLVRRAARIAEIEQVRPPESAHEHTQALIQELEMSRSREAARRGTLPPPRSSGDLRTMGRDSGAALEPSAILVELQPVSEVHRRDTPTPALPFPSPGDGDLSPDDHDPAEKTDPSSSSQHPSQRPSQPEVPTIPRNPREEAQSSTPRPRLGTLSAPAAPKASLLAIGEKVRAKLSDLPRPILALLVGMLGLGILVLLVPAYVARSYVSAAAKRGIVLGVDDLELSFSHTRLLGCTATFPEMPGVWIRAKALDFGFVKGAPPTMTAVELAIAIDGHYEPTHDTIGLYLATHPLKDAGTDRAIERIYIEQGHLQWTRAFGENTQLEISGIRGEMVRTGDRELGRDYALAAERIVLGTPLGSIGPWRGNLTRAGASLVTNITLSTDSAEPATATYMDQDAEDTNVVTLEAKIPRCPMEKIGIPRAMLGLAPNAALEVEGTLRAIRESRRDLGRAANLAADGAGAKCEAEAAFALDGVRLAGAARATGVRFQGRVMGDPNAMLEIDGGVMTLGAFRARLSGTGTFLHDGFRIEGTWKSVPRPCAVAWDGPPEVTIPELAADATELDRAIAAPALPNQMALAGAFFFDSRDVSKTRVAATPPRPCA
ncbi:MAG TPA: protein kinase, partial [Polyangiaceae bacterium]|nr:protein kinase [Polyangiaceae bacterium]